ncbi:MAG: aminoacyl-tRNA hydrolase [Deltaproteobacteria bacterium]|nr:aminoacyl-tRNA hydrolase [Deltaproteobacteria bacterium]MBW2019311.1 aminoacyl-tRNA hydrolase [Deltaproteobacteria bacterium]MBW2074359.1 aminoacyl-tRNA hydrolase [Deltaproteobacteria bacterium]RLB82291.1 MAG: aminoacyl-tRNA hydrolase [Deltaproteobacteria bacterium]
MPERRFQLIVGLGNPGEAYRLTRHNVGFRVVDRLAYRHRILLDKRKFGVVFGLGEMDGRSVILAKPMTFMNLSGPPIRKVAHFFNLDQKDLLVIHDDIDLVFGKIKIKQKGGDGGHNGVKSLIEAFGSGAFARIRIGIGRPRTNQEVKEYVLNRFDAQQEAVVDKVITMAQDAVETILLKGLTEGMNQFSRKEIGQK